MVTVGPLLIGVSVSLTSWLISFSMGFTQELPELGVVLLKVVPLFLTVAAFALLYLAVPNRAVALKDALTGGVVAGLVFEAMKRGFAIYIATFPTYKMVYGTFAVIPIFLLWIYLSWLVALFGAVVTAVLPDWRSGAPAAGRAPGQPFTDALRILHELYRAHGAGKRDPLSQYFIDDDEPRILAPGIDGDHPGGPDRHGRSED